MKRFKKAGDIKVGVIGYGGEFDMGRMHLNFMKQAGMTPTAVVEIDPKRLKAARKDFPEIETYSSTTQMLKKSDVNLTTIITPHNSHAKLAIQCMRAGRSVVCEKPMAITTAECDAMIAAAEKNKVLLSAFHNRHWDGCILQALKTIRRGAIGDVARVALRVCNYARPAKWWRSSRSISGGILYDWGVHLLEYALQIIDSKIVEVSGFAHDGFWGPKTAWKSDSNEDEALAVVRFAGGKYLTLQISDIDANADLGDNLLEITGTKGTYLANLKNWTLVKPTRSGRIVKKGKNPKAQWWRYYANIAENLTGKGKLIITARWARRPIHIIDLAVKSAKKGSAMKAKDGKW